MNNGLSGAKSIARSEAMAAYWNAIENDSSITEAKQAGKQASRDFYATKLQQVANSWNLLVGSWRGYSSIEGSSLPDDYVGGVGNGTHLHNFGVTENVSVTAPNGDSVDFMGFRLERDSDNQKAQIYPTKENLIAGGMGDPFDSPVHLEVATHNQTFEGVESPQIDEYESMVETIYTDSQEVDQAVNTVADQTYQKALNGELNVSEMLSANTIAREYSREGNDQAWAAVRLSQIQDVGLPENLDGIGNVTVKSGGETTTGLFLSKSNPQSGQFEAGTTYNASELAGGQYVVTQSGNWDEITGEFTLSEIKGSDGGSVDSITVRNPTTEATNISEWRERMDRLEEMRAEINARQQKLLNQSGDGPTWPNPFKGLSGTQSILAIVAVAGAALLILRN
jgi:hypothetical protein